MKTAVLFVLPVVLLAQDAPPIAQDPAKARLEGQVLNSVTNEPVRKARLTLRMNVAATTTYSATSDAMGKFEFANVDPGDYQLSIRHDGFADLVLGARNAARKNPILLAASDRKNDFLVRLVPHGTISGSVLDEDGDPIRNMTVAAMTYLYTNNGRELQVIRSANSNDLGEYRIFDLPPGKYFLKVGHQGIRLLDNPEGADDYGSVFYPSSPQVSGAIVQEVTPGAHLHNLNFNVRKVHYATVRGRVVAPPTAADVFVRMSIVSEDGTSSTSRDVKGKDFQFEFIGVAPGPVHLTGSYLLNGRPYSTYLPIEVGGSDIDGIELRPLPPTVVSGQVRVAGTNAIQGSRLVLQLRAQGIGVFNALVQEDGTFTAVNLPPAAYPLYIDGMPKGLYIKSIHLGTTEITDTTLDLTAGVPPRTELSILLGADGGQISGVVTNENVEPCDGVTVTLIPTGARNSRLFYKFVTTDASGKFTITGIAPGTYRLLAWDKVDNNEVMFDPDFLRPYESAAQTVEIVANDKKTLDLKLTLNKE
jgi:hypothetical protein